MHNLHFASAKNYDGFSYIALWNPIQFYVDWGYRRYSSNLTTHHDAITCLGNITDNHFSRQVKALNTFHLKPEIILNHTNARDIPDFDEFKEKIFYSSVIT